MHPEVTYTYEWLLVMWSSHFSSTEYYAKTEKPLTRLPSLMVIGVPSTRESKSVEAHIYTQWYHQVKATRYRSLSTTTDPKFVLTHRLFMVFIFFFPVFFLFLPALHAPAQQPAPSTHSFYLVVTLFFSFCWAEWNVPILDGRCWDTCPEHFL